MIWAHSLMRDRGSCLIPASSADVCSFVHYACNLDRMVHAIESKTCYESASPVELPQRDNTEGRLTSQQRKCTYFLSFLLLPLPHFG